MKSFTLEMIRFLIRTRRITDMMNQMIQRKKPEQFLWQRKSRLRQL